jgi:hypothetical protein
MRTSSSGLARGAVAGFGSLWPLCIPALVVGVAIDAWFRSPGWVFACTAVGILALWYMVIARIPGQLRVHNIRTEVPDSIVCSVRLTRFLFHSATTVDAPLRSSPPRIGGTALVATPADLQIWAGRVGDPFPWRTVPWNTIESVFSAKRSALGAHIIVRLKDGDQFGFAAATNLPFVAEYRRGAARERLVAQLVSVGKLQDHVVQAHGSDPKRTD